MRHSVLKRYRPSTKTHHVCSFNFSVMSILSSCCSMSTYLLLKVSWSPNRSYHYVWYLLRTASTILASSTPSFAPFFLPVSVASPSFDFSPSVDSLLSSPCAKKREREVRSRLLLHISMVVENEKDNFFSPSSQNVWLFENARRVAKYTRIAILRLKLYLFRGKESAFV